MTCLNGLNLTQPTCCCFGDDCAAGGAGLPGPLVPSAAGPTGQGGHLGLGCGQGIIIGLKLGRLK